jgi:DNA-binding MarR family transcriptional regulator
MDELLQPNHCVSNQLHQTARAVNRVYSEELRAVGLNRGQFSILAHLNSLKSSQLTELATLLFMDRTTLSRNLKPLEAKWLVRVTPGVDDRRARWVELTDEGQQLFTAAIERWRNAQKRILDSFGSDNWLQLESDLEILRNSKL